ncbi:hypothetical protein JY651_18320 [Pyxidicoccus parkwayensis]|uniref:Alginate lyase domain-containing protein n=1 Tax=Pyxidicoccus parkwayensis TaxID=2813578 RepID=A0ABX7P8J7_9BACT|nr:hypothetical protein [Pyxidicoccus parkwaysis]QSQ26758.1 hypothetical protein JY651_18320 [Pyxidicoccus parkwaysis]
MDLATIIRRFESHDAPALSRDDHAAREVEHSLAYLGSEVALASLAQDPYWPKWDSPWWHLLLLHERGASERIPGAAAEALVAAISRLPLKIFPIHPEDTPAGLDASRDAFCHCALGCIVPVLLACGVDVDTRLPWARDWFARYQMADGGLSCDAEAYLVQGEVPSSMVGTVAPLEAMLALTAVRTRPEDVAFMDRAAGFLVGRALVRGSDTVHNAEERGSATGWPQLTFPRFYFYDVLRGLAVLVEWAHRLRRPLPWSAIAHVVGDLEARFPDGQVRIGRQAFAGKTTRVPAEDGRWTKRVPASNFPLLDASSRVGEVSPFLTRSWQTTRERLVALARAGLLHETE